MARPSGAANQPCLLCPLAIERRPPGGIAGNDEMSPGKLGRRVIGVLAFAGRAHFDDVPGGIVEPRDWRIDLVDLAPVVVGHRGVDLAGDRDWVRCPPGGPSASRREDRPRRAGLDHDVGLVAKPLAAVSGPSPWTQRQPLQLAVFEKLGDVEGAVIQQVHVGGAVARIELARSDELVEVVEALVVAGVENDAAVLVDDRRGALVLEAAQRGALHRRRVGVVGIDIRRPSRTGSARSAPW